VPLVNYVEEFITRLRKAGRDARYIYQVERHILKFCKECSWTYFKDVGRDSFERWRSRQDVEPKTLNEHQSSASMFFTWLFKCGRIPSQPLAGVEKARLRGTDKRERRAFTGEELQILLAVAGDRAVVYLTAVYTGLRRGELKALEWRDLHLDGDTPHIRARASTTKNGKAASLPLHPDVVASLRVLQGKGHPEPKVFPRLVPEMELFKKHLALAGIAYNDERGRNADFHSLRNTFATILTLNGAPQREVMELMRHSDMRLTAKVYTDAGQLPLSKTMNALPSVNRMEQIVELDSVPTRQNESTPVPPENLAAPLERPKIKASGFVEPALSTPVPSGKNAPVRNRT